MKELLIALADVLEVGAQRFLNNDRQQDADVLQAMADKARILAETRFD